MKLFKMQTLLALVMSCSALATAHAQSRTDAQDWPSKAVRIMVPAAPGTAPDIMVRTVGDRLGKMWGQPVVIENRPGAGGLIGLANVKNSNLDDHTFVFAPASVYVLTPYLYKNSQVDVIQDFVPVTLAAIGPMMIAVNADSQINSMSDLVAAARKHSDFIISTTSQFTMPHMAVEVLAKAADINVRAMPYSASSQSMGAVINGDAQAVIDGIPPLESMVKGGRLKALGVFSEKRLANREQIPTVMESIDSPSMVINGWFAITAPKGTNDAVIEKASRDISTVLGDPAVATTFDQFGVYPSPSTPVELGSFLSDERARWTKVLADVGAPVVEQ